MNVQLDDFLQIELTFAINQHADQEIENYLLSKGPFWTSF